MKFVPVTGKVGGICTLTIMASTLAGQPDVSSVPELLLLRRSPVPAVVALKALSEIKQTEKIEKIEDRATRVQIKERARA